MLEEAIQTAISEEGQDGTATKAYLSFFKNQLFLPIEKGSGDEPRVLFLETPEQIFLPVFSQQEILVSWAAETIEKIDIFECSGVELIAGLGDNVTLSFNPGTDSYKEFNAEEILKLKTMVAKIRNLVAH